MEDYEWALLRGGTSLGSTRLQGRTVEKVSGRQTPKRRPGGAGAVYCFQGDPTWAVKVFTRMLEHGGQRFTCIGTYLAKSAAHEYFLEFEYLQKGIYVNEWFPTIVMQWCPGQCLDAYIENQIVEHGAVDRDRLVHTWLDLIADLRRRGIIHGDLQHGNVLVDDKGRFRLVDYDGMIVPTMTGALIRTEEGHPDYRHPRRGSESTDPSVAELRRYEDLAALVVLVSLAAVDPQIWSAHGNDGLLLKAGDLQRPDASPALEAIAQRGTKAAKLVECLRGALRDVEATPGWLGQAAGLFDVRLPEWLEGTPAAPVDPSRARRRAVPGWKIELEASREGKGAAVGDATPRGRSASVVVPGAAPVGADRQPAEMTARVPEPVKGERALTPRQYEILAGLAAHFSYADIADRLGPGVSRSDVQLEVRMLRLALGVTSNFQAVPAARRLGLFPASGPKSTEPASKPRADDQLPKRQVLPPTRRRNDPIERDTTSTGPAPAKGVPAKRTPAKRTPAKRTPAKRTPAKRTSPKPAPAKPALTRGLPPVQPGPLRARPEERAGAPAPPGKDQGPWADRLVTLIWVAIALAVLIWLVFF